MTSWIDRISGAYKLDVDGLLHTRQRPVMYPWGLSAGHDVLCSAIPTYKLATCIALRCLRLTVPSVMVQSLTICHAPSNFREGTKDAPMVYLEY